MFATGETLPDLHEKHRPIVQMWPACVSVVHGTVEGVMIIAYVCKSVCVWGLLVWIKEGETPQRKQAPTRTDKAVLIAFCDTMLYYGLVPFIQQWQMG